MIKHLAGKVLRMENHPNSNKQTKKTAFRMLIKKLKHMFI